MRSYQDRAEAETMTWHPALPCPHCGHDVWGVERPWRMSKSDRPLLIPVVCRHCHVMETAHHVHGEWLGMYMYSRYCGPLTDSFSEFVQEHAAYLREPV